MSNLIENPASLARNHPLHPDNATVGIHGYEVGEVCKSPEVQQILGSGTVWTSKTVSGVIEILRHSEGLVVFRDDEGKIFVRRIEVKLC